MLYASLSRCARLQGTRLRLKLTKQVSESRARKKSGRHPLTQPTQEKGPARTRGPLGPLARQRRLPTRPTRDAGQRARASRRSRCATAGTKALGPRKPRDGRRRRPMLPAPEATAADEDDAVIAAPRARSSRGPGGVCRRRRSRRRSPGPLELRARKRRLPTQQSRGPRGVGRRLSDATDAGLRARSSRGPGGPGVGRRPSGPRLTPDQGFAQVAGPPGL